MDKKSQDYYNLHAEAYFALTKDTFIPKAMEVFLSRMREGGRILDLGCGSGRDSRYFLERGFQVTALDGSKEMCRLASLYIQKPVVHCDYFSFVPEDLYDGIWAQASLVHLEKKEIQAMLKRLSSWLKQDGTVVLSFCYGDFVGERDGRFYTYLTEESFPPLLCGSGLEVISSWHSQDARPGYSFEWLNLLLQKSPRN